MTKATQSDRALGDHDLLDHHRRKLKCAGARIVAITQEVEQDAEGDLVRTKGRAS